MQKTSKIISTLLIVFILISIVSNVFAYSPNLISANESSTNGIVNWGGKILGIIQVIGSITAVVILVVLGIKYMLGSAEEKAEYKKTMIPYLVGAVLIFGASTLSNVIYNWIKG